MSWMIFDKVFVMAINLLVVVKIANHFGAREYGSYEYAVNMVALFEILVAFVDGRVVKKQYDKRNSDEVVFTATICRILFSLVAALLGIFYIILSNRNTQFSVMFSILLVNAIVANLRFGMTNRFEYLLKSKMVVIASDIALTVGTCLQLFAVYLDLSIIAISVIALVVSCVNLIIVFLQYKLILKGKFRCNIDKDLIYQMIKESAPLAIASSCATIYTKSDSVMIGSMMTTAEVGIYAISTKLISCVQIAKVPIQESLFPKLISLYNTDKKSYEKLYIKATSILTWIYIIGTIFAFAILPLVFSIFNKEYLDAMGVFKVHVLGTFFIYNAALRAGHFTLINKGSVLMWSQLFSVIANIVLNYFGIMLCGMYGAAIATVFTQALSLMFSNLLFGKDGRQVFKWQIKALNPVYILK